MRTLLVLGTGGTIAGVQRHGDPSGGYTAAVLGVDALLDGVDVPEGWQVRAHQVVSIDSKDMRWSVWQALASRLAEGLADEGVAGVVITHGTDTLEETACVLDWLHDQRKPVVLTGAMRPATADDADGPANLRDALSAVQVLSSRGLGGTWVAMNACLWPGSLVRKVHTREVNAFDAGGAQPLARRLPDGVWQPAVQACQDGPFRAVQAPLWRWFATQARPRVECVSSHADADGWVVRALLSADGAASLKGLVVACTGHGTVQDALADALNEACAQGVQVWRSTRVARGGVLSRADDRWPAAGPLTVAQARVALALHLLGAPQRGCVRAFFDRPEVFKVA